MIRFTFWFTLALSIAGNVAATWGHHPRDMVIGGLFPVLLILAERVLHKAGRAPWWARVALAVIVAACIIWSATHLASLADGWQRWLIPIAVDALMLMSGTLLMLVPAQVAQIDAHDAQVVDLSAQVARLNAQVLELSAQVSAQVTAQFTQVPDLSAQVPALAEPERLSEDLSALTPEVEQVERPDLSDLSASAESPLKLSAAERRALDLLNTYGPHGLPAQRELSAKYEWSAGTTAAACTAYRTLTSA